jgi:hypothetical protein
MPQPASQETTRRLPPQLRLASIQPKTFDAEARTVEITWTTGARVRRYDWWTDESYDEELDVSEHAVDMSRLSSGAAPVLDSHNKHELASQIGVVDRAWLDGDAGRAVIRLSQRADVAGIVEDIRAGIIRNISVGYNVRKYQVTREEGAVPVYRAIDWQPCELSFVTVPADPDATTRSQPAQGDPCVFVRAASAHPHQERSTMAQPVPAAEAATAAEAAPAIVAAAPAAAAPVDTTQRSADIVELATRHGMADQAAGWLRAGHDVDQVRKIILDSRAAADDATGGHHNRVDAGLDQVDKERAAAMQVLLSRSQIQDPATKRVVAIESGNPFRGHTLLDLARGSLERIGVRTAGLSKLELVGRSFTQSGSDFPILLENTLHKALQASYAVAPDTWSRFCSTGSVSDFRAHNRYRVGSLGNLDALTELSEFKSKVIPDGEKASIQASTKGNIINLSRQAIINDDLSSFIGLAVAFGRAAKRTVESDVYALLASNPSINGEVLFHSSRNNIGTSAAPTVASIDEARVLLAAQKDISGHDFLDLRPALWLGPLKFGGSMRVINDSQFDHDGAKLQQPNKVRGLVRDVIDTPRIAGNTWYLFADPADAPVIEVAFLDGASEPFLEQHEGFHVDGTCWKVRLDFGIAVIDWRGAVRNAGG